MTHVERGGGMIPAVALCCALLLAALPAAAADITIALRARAAVAGPYVWLDEVADIAGYAGERLCLDRAPLPGSDKTLVATRVAATVKRLLPRGTEISISGEAVNVTRATQTLRSADLVAAAAAALRERYAGCSRLDLEPLGLTPDDLLLTTDTFTVAAEPSGLPYTGRDSVRVTVSQQGRAMRSVNIAFRTVPYATVAVTDAAIARGALLAADAVRCEERALTGLRGTPVTDAAGLAGQRSTRLLAAGDIIVHEACEPVPVICRGDAVRVTVLRGGVVLTTSGIARQDGCAGETIRVNNADSGRLLRAEVAGPGAVIIR